MRQIITAIWRDTSSAMCFFFTLVFLYFSFPQNSDAWPLMLILLFSTLVGFWACIVEYNNEQEEKERERLFKQEQTNNAILDKM